MKIPKVGEKHLKSVIADRKYMALHGGPPPYTDEEISVIRKMNMTWNQALEKKNQGSEKDFTELLSPVAGLKELRNKDKAHAVAKRLLGSRADRKS